MRSALFSTENLEKESQRPGLRLQNHRADQAGPGTLLGRGTGEAFTMSLAGQGFVVVQPSQERPHGLLD
ncbi:hypothetical protein GCM10010170_008400 [Dactylosporangium salmoneum]|uniref:Uncharacterized protein n=1 Tax=Dactylosporangium salmoneum TaxID=53361 RepID=A0ABN3FHW8_9ACTN